MANREHVAKLLEGVEAWNEWRKANPDWDTIDLYEADLVQTDLTGFNLTGAYLVGSDLRGARLCGARLIGASLCQAQLGGADFSRARLDRAIFTNAPLHRTNLCGADLTYADLGYTRLEDVNLRGARLRRAYLKESMMRRVDLRGANLRQTDLSEAFLSHADVSGANLTDAYLCDAYWCEVKACGARFDKSRLRGFRAARCDFTGATCARADCGDHLRGEPKWQWFAPGEFAKLYSDAFAVEMLFERGVPFRAIGQLVDALGSAWRQEHSGGSAVPDAIEVRPNDIVVKLGAGPENVAPLRECCEETIREFLQMSGAADGERANMIARNSSYAIVGKFSSPELQRALGSAITINLVQGDQVETKVLGNPHHLQTNVGEVNVLGGVVNIADVISRQSIQQGITGAALANALQDAYGAGNFEARLAEVESAFAKLPDDQQQATLQQTKAAISPDMKGFLLNALANATGGLFAGGLLKLIGG
jgi:uncharacterized protein YjbI with pentapeptide repeats